MVKFYFRTCYRLVIDAGNASSISADLRFIKFIFRLSVCFASMPYNADINYPLFVVYRIDDPIFPNSYTPQLARPLKLPASAWKWIRFEGFDSIENTLGRV